MPGTVPSVSAEEELTPYRGFSTDLPRFRGRLLCLDRGTQCSRSAWMSEQAPGSLGAVSRLALPCRPAWRCSAATGEQQAGAGTPPPPSPPPQGLWQTKMEQIHTWGSLILFVLWPSNDRAPYRQRAVVLKNKSLAT